LASSALEHAAAGIRKGREIGGEDFFKTLLDLTEAGFEVALRIAPRDLGGRSGLAGIPEEILSGRGVMRDPVGGEEGQGLPVSERVTTNGFRQAHLLAFSKGAQVERDGQRKSPGIES
jgi:hypothetical protein